MERLAQWNKMPPDFSLPASLEIVCLQQPRNPVYYSDMQWIVYIKK